MPAARAINPVTKGVSQSVADASRRRPYTHPGRSSPSARSARRLPAVRDHGQPVGEQDPAIRRWGKRGNVELWFTSVSASWANPIEAQFGPVRTFVTGGSDYRNHTALARRLQAYLRWRNANARTLTCWPSSAANQPASAANASNAGAAPSLKPHDEPGERSWPAH